MGVRINTNIEALNAQRNLGATSLNFAKSVEKLSSGLRINRAADDAAGLSISEKLRAQIKGLNQAVRNSQDAISMIQTGEGALNEVHSMLQRMRELAVQASNDTLSDNDRGAINTELQQLTDEVNGISTRTKFNGKALMTGALATTQSGTSTAEAGAVVVAGTNTAITKVDVAGAAAGTTFTFSDTGTAVRLSDGTNTQDILYANAAVSADGSTVLDFNQLGIKVTVGSVSGETAANVAAGLATKTVVTAAGSATANYQIGADSSDTLSVAFSHIDLNGSTAAAELDDLKDQLDDFNTNYNTTTAVSSAQTLIDKIDDAIDYVATQRASLGAYQNRLEHTIANLGVASENLAASESRVRDVDLASEMVNFTKTQILQQAGTSILAQANQAPQSVMQLLR